MAVNKLILGTVALALLGASPAHAGDAAMPTKAPALPAYDWTGAYLGGHFGYGGGSLGFGTNPVLDEGVVFPPTITGLIGGYQIGWNVQLPDRLGLGVEGGVTFTSPTDRGATHVPAPFNTKLDYIGTAPARARPALARPFPDPPRGPGGAATPTEIHKH